MRDLLRAAGLEDHQAREYDIDGARIAVVRLSGDAEQARGRARAALTGHYPVLLMDPADLHPQADDVLARAADVDLDADVAQWLDRQDADTLGVGDEGYDLDCYDVASYGVPEFLALLPRPEPWAAFAYVHPYSGLGLQPELMVAAARRWHERHGAEPAVIGLACGFAVPRPPTDPVDAERLAVEHVRLAGLTAGTTVRAYARALPHLDHWTLYDRP